MSFLIAAIAIAGLAAVPPAGAQAKPPVPRLIFPVVGPGTYVDDYGDPRGQGSHQGIDIMAPRKAVAVAAEAGTVSFWTTSARAGCMLYLHGKSGTRYLYIHLNNDLGKGNDNKGRCVPGVAYAPGLKSGAAVAAGEHIGYVGDSGDADGISPHLHFEVQRKGVGSVNPFVHLNRAQKLLFPAKLGTTFTLALRGDVAEAADGSLKLKVDQVRRWPGGLLVPKVNRTVQLTLPASAVVFNPLGALIAAAQVAEAAPGKPATVFTEPAPATLHAQLGVPGALTAQKVQLTASR
jgi:hypothetical protein